MNLQNIEYDVIVIGAGPAGMTAGIYLRRSNLSVLMIDKEVPGGKVVTTAYVENYPGFINISGPELALKMFEQTKANEVKFLLDEVLNIKQRPDKKWEVELGSKETKIAKAIIVATGMKNKKLDIPNQTKFENHGLSYCAICDGAFHKNLPVAVIGSGRSAVEESIYLSDIASKVYLISNKEKFKADEKDIDKLKTKENIEIIMNTNTISYNGDNHLKSITIENQKTKAIKELEVHGAFVFIGFLPIAPRINGEIMLSPVSNFIDVDNDMNTKWPGIFSAGDITNKKIRQISTAISDGSVAAMSVHQYISDSEWEK